MTLLKAFVSHSFLEVDEPIVKKFIDLLDQVAANNQAFSWDHAIRAEPRSISEKIEEMIKDKNVFIGICSRRERVCDDGNVVTWPFLGNRIEPKNLGWKTSDWIIQEIGLARGRGCAPILLLEDSVLNPAPLLADLEHIRFDRKNPEGSFTRLLAMIASLSPHRKNVPTTEATPVASKPPPSSENENGEDDYEPKPDWSVTDFRRALTGAIASKHAPPMQSNAYPREAFAILRQTHGLGDRGEAEGAPRRPPVAFCHFVDDDQYIRAGAGEQRLRYRIAVVELVWSKNLSRRSASVEIGCSITPPLDNNSAEAHPTVRGTAQAPRGGGADPEETAEHCPSPGDSARHGNGRHSRSAPAARSARQRGLPWTSTPP
jgi:hypothetical protein